MSDSDTAALKKRLKGYLDQRYGWRSEKAKVEGRLRSRSDVTRLISPDLTLILSSTEK